MKIDARSIVLDMDLIEAAADLWDVPADEAVRVNPEYLRGQLDTITNLTPRGVDVDVDEVRGVVRSVMFAGR